MSLATLTAQATYAGDGSTTAFSFPYKYVNHDDFVVQLELISSGALTTQILDTHYTVTATSAATNGVYPGASITFVTAPSALYNVIISRDPPLTQEFDFDAEADPLPVLTRYADYVAMRLQSLSRRIVDADALLSTSILSSGSTTPRALGVRFAEVRRAEDFGAAADGTTDDATAIQALLTAGYVWAPVPGASYAIGTRLNITSDGSGYRGDGTATLIMLSGSGKFDNTSSSAGDRYGADAVGIYATGRDRVICKGLRIKYQTQTDDRYVKAIAIKSSTNVLIDDNEIWNFTKSLGLIYIGACEHVSITNNYIHDGYTNSATNGQITGIELDNDDTPSSDVDIIGNRIIDLTVGATFLALAGGNNYQTDGINTVKASADVRIANNHIENVGEGIDFTYGTDSVVFGNTVVNAYIFGIKCIHGASRNLIYGNLVRNAGLGGIVLAGGSTDTVDTADNLIFNNEIFGIDPNSVWSANTSYGIGIIANGGVTYLPRRNVIANNVIDCQTNGDLGVYAAASSGALNQVRDNVVRNAGTSSYSLDRTTVPYTDAPPFVYDLELKGADIASVAGTTNVAAATGEFLDITGTNAITGFGTASAGVIRKVRFTGAASLTHNGTSFILPGAANITCAANDTAGFASLGSGNWICLWYKRASGQPIVPISVANLGSTSYAAPVAFSISGVDFNSANTDNAIAISLPTGFTRYSVGACRIDGASQTLTTATCGLFTAAAAGGVAIVASGSAITVSTASENTNNNMQALTIANQNTQSYRLADVPTLYFRVQTAQGAAATGKVTVSITPLP